MFFTMFIGLFLFCVHFHIQEFAVLHSSVARMETVSATLLLCAIISMTVETIVMNLDVVCHSIKTCLMHESDVAHCSVKRMSVLYSSHACSIRIIRKYMYVLIFEMNFVIGSVADDLV